MKTIVFWDWWDFGIMFRVYRSNEIARYEFQLDIQVAWLNLWINCWKR